LSLGAGFDSAYFRLKSDERIDDVVFCEVYIDFINYEKDICSHHDIAEKLLIWS